MSWLSLASVLRFPILFLVLLLLLSFWAPRTALLRGIFDVQPKHLWKVAGSALMAAASIVVCFWVIVANGPQRFGIPALLSATPPIGWLFVASLALAAPSLIKVWKVSTAGSAGTRLASMLGGIAAIILASWFPLHNVDWVYARIGFLLPLIDWIGPGYLDPQGRPGVEHLFGFGWVLLTFLFYIALGVSHWLLLATGTRKAGEISTLASLFLLLSLGVSSLAGITFLLDYWHVPTLTFLITIVGALAMFRSTDHTFKVTPTSIEPLSPRDTLLASGHQEAVLVTAAGGGIHLAAWTAKVLTELSKLPGFAERVRLVSSVSGGSVGSLYWLQTRFEGKARPEDVMKAATRSSLDSVAWGLLYADFIRLLLPILPDSFDRGWALERAWERDWNFPPDLSEWRKKVRTGEMPAVLFNTTVVQTGERITIPTTDLDPIHPDVDVRRTFYEIHPNLDLSPLTAARLSATFPFVSPAARADRGEIVHFVDGGYFDNFGTASLTQWLRDAVPVKDSRVKRILVVNITGCKPSPKPRCNPPIWSFQFHAPLEALLNVRNASQRTRRDIEQKLITEAMLKSRGVEVEFVDFANPTTDAPLSWHLLPPEIREIDDVWTAMAGQRDKVARFLAAS
jgi:hypothetical protein